MDEATADHAHALRGREADVVSSLQVLEDECIHTNTWEQNFARAFLSLA